MEISRLKELLNAELEINQKVDSVIRKLHSCIDEIKRDFVFTEDLDFEYRLKILMSDHYRFLFDDLTQSIRISTESHSIVLPYYIFEDTHFMFDHVLAIAHEEYYRKHGYFYNEFLEDLDQYHSDVDLYNSINEESENED